MLRYSSGLFARTFSPSEFPFVALLVLDPESFMELMGRYAYAVDMIKGHQILLLSLFPSSLSIFGSM